MIEHSFIKIFISLILIADSVIAQEEFHLLATMSGDSLGDGFSIVAGVGDVNGDGYDDVLVGAPGGQWGEQVGRYAKLYFGGSVFDTLADLTFRDDKINSLFGYSVANGGDINGDGYPDIVIGAPGTWVGPSWPFQIVPDVGAVYIYFGGPGLDTTADLELIVGSWEEQTGWYYDFGYSLDFAGDMNGDDYDDLIVSAPNDDYDAHGRAYIYYGGPEVDDQYDILLEGEDHFDMFGQSVSSSGDVNKDGFDDVIIGAPQSLTYPPGKPGKTYLVYGGDEISLANSEVFTGDTSMYNYGRIVSGLGDVNGDGYPDFGIMADHYFNIYSGSSRKSILTVLGDTSKFETFYAMTGGKDVDNDGISDIALSLAGAVNGEGFNKLLFYKGDNIIGSIPDEEIIKDEYSYLVSTSFLGDLNNDSCQDIILGDRGILGPNGRTLECGKVYIYSFGEIDDVKDIGDEFPTSFQLYRNYPNPFNPTTKINYSIPAVGTSFMKFVTLKVYDILGNEVATLVNEEKSAGNYEVKFDASEYKLSSGIYIYTLRAGNRVISNKMIYLK